MNYTFFSWSLIDAPTRNGMRSRDPNTNAMGCHRSEWNGTSGVIWYRLLGWSIALFQLLPTSMREIVLERLDCTAKNPGVPASICKLGKKPGREFPIRMSALIELFFLLEILCQVDGQVKPLGRTQVLELETWTWTWTWWWWWWSIGLY